MSWVSQWADRNRIAQWLNQRPDVLLIDLAMPKMDGYELLEKIRGLEQEVGWLPSIAFTASVRSEDRVRSRRARSKVRISNQLRARQRVSSS